MEDLGSDDGEGAVGQGDDTVAQAGDHQPDQASGARRWPHHGPRGERERLVEGTRRADRRARQAARRAGQAALGARRVARQAGRVGEEVRGGEQHDQPAGRGHKHEEDGGTARAASQGSAGARPEGGQGARRAEVGRVEELPAELRENEGRDRQAGESAEGAEDTARSHAQGQRRAQLALHQAAARERGAGVQQRDAGERERAQGARAQVARGRGRLSQDRDDQAQQAQGDHTQAPQDARGAEDRDGDGEGPVAHHHWQSGEGARAVEEGAREGEEGGGGVDARARHAQQELVERVQEHREAEQSDQDARPVDQALGAGDSQLQGGGEQAAQAHLSAREGARSLHIGGERAHAARPPAHGGDQGERDAGVRLQEEDRRAGDQVQAAAEPVRSGAQRSQLVQQESDRAPGRDQREQAQAQDHDASDRPAQGGDTEQGAVARQGAHAPRTSGQGEGQPEGGAAADEEDGGRDEGLHRLAANGGAQAAQDHPGGGRRALATKEATRAGHTGARHTRHAARATQRRAGAALREDQDTAVDAEQGRAAVQDARRGHTHTQVGDQAPEAREEDTRRQGGQRQRSQQGDLSRAARAVARAHALPGARGGARESDECAPLAQARGQRSGHLRAHTEDPGAPEASHHQDRRGRPQRAAHSGEGEALHRAQAHTRSPARTRGRRAAIHLSADAQGQNKADEGK